MTSEYPANMPENIQNGLESSDPTRVIETIEELRVSGKISDIPVLIELLHLSQDAEIKSKITDLFANLKEIGSIPLIIEAIQNQKYAPELKELVACCWENGLDYSNYLSLFVDLLIDTNFLIAFEAYTVIMNMTTRIDQGKLDVEIERLKKSMQNTTDEKKALMLDVIEFLPSMES